MRTQLVEATNNNRNWGKFLIGAFDEAEWEHRSAVAAASGDPRRFFTPLLVQRGWGPEHRLVLDIETGEGAVFRPGGLASADLDKHKVWVCPLFQPFLEWWWERWPEVDVGTFPDLVQLPDAAFQWSGYRRPGVEAPASPRGSLDEDAKDVLRALAALGAPNFRNEKRECELCGIPYPEPHAPECPWRRSRVWVEEHDG